MSGPTRNRDAWRGYFDAFPDYVIAPEQLAETGTRVAVLGHTTGSHLGLSDDEEQVQTLIWLVDIVDGQVAAWRLVEDTPTARDLYGLPVERGADMSVNLCVLLWASRGPSRRPRRVRGHRARVPAGPRCAVLQRVRTQGQPTDQPYEVHVLEFPSEEALDAYLQDPRRAGPRGTTRSSHRPDGDPSRRQPARQ